MTRLLASSPVRSSSAHSTESRIICPNPDRLATRPLSVDADNDPPPFIPGPDDHISLNQFDSQIGALYERKLNTVGPQTPRLYRRSTSSIRYEPLIRLEFPSPKKADNITHRGRSKTKERRRRRRPISAPGKKTVRLPSRRHWPSPADKSLRESESGDVEEICESKSSLLSIYEAAGEIFEPGPRRRAESHPGIFVPLEIRLRRASEQPTESTSRRASLPGPRPAPIRSSAESKTHGSASHKGSLAGAALTQAYIHMYLPSEQRSEERRSSTWDRQRKISATLQVVRSRDSIYEVIWEDATAVLEKASTTSSSSSSSPGIQLPSSPYPTDFHRRKHTNVKTDLAGWSWGGELEPYRNVQMLGKLNLTSERRSYSSKHQSRQEETSRRSDLGVDPRVQVEASEDPPEDISEDNAVMEINDEIRTQRASTASKFRCLAPVPGAAARLTTQQRHDMLGSRKLSNLPTEEERFASHRDSLILAHERIFHKDQEVRPEQQDRRVQSLKKANWHKPRIPQRVAMAQAPLLNGQYLNSMVPTSANVRQYDQTQRSKFGASRKKLQQGEIQASQNVDN